MTKKNKVVRFFIDAWKHLTVNQRQVKSLVKSEKELSNKLLVSQEETIRLQGEIIRHWQEFVTSRNEKLQKVRSAAEESEKDTFQHEMRSYSDDVKTSSNVVVQPEISSEYLQKVMGTVAEEEPRAKNVILCGLWDEFPRCGGRREWTFQRARW